MRTLQEILLDQRQDAQVIEAEFDAIELREVLTNPATLQDLNAIKSWEF